MSSVAVGPWLSDSTRQRASGMSTSPIGTLIQKIQCQEMPCDHRAADQRADRDGDPLTARPHADRGAAALGGEGLGEQRERERGDHRGAGSLHRACATSSPVVGRERRGRRGRGEQRQPDREHPPAPEAVSERRAGEQQHRVGERRRR